MARIVEIFLYHLIKFQKNVSWPCMYSGIRKVMYDVFVILIMYVYLIMHEKYIGIGKKFRKLLFYVRRKINYTSKVLSLF